MARTSNQARQRISMRNPAAKVRTIPCLERASRTRANATTRAPARKVLPITVSGAWLRAAGFRPARPASCAHSRAGSWSSVSRTRRSHVSIAIRGSERASITALRVRSS
jgi:hypothetical protein